MRHPAKLFSLVAIATLIAPAIQTPGFSATLQPHQFNREEFSVLAQETNNLAPQAEADRLFQQGLNYYRNRRFQEALQAWEQALVIYREINNYEWQNYVLRNLGLTYIALDQYFPALDSYRQALAISREMGDRQSEGQTLLSIGTTHLLFSEYQQAISYYQQALSVAQQTGNRVLESSAIARLADVYRDTAQYEQAIDFCRQALSIASKTGDGGLKIEVLIGCGYLYVRLGQYEQAIEQYEQALAVNSEIGSPIGEAYALGNIGYAYYLMGQYPLGIDYLERALTITQRIGERRGESLALSVLGLLYTSVDQYDKAISYYNQALAIAIEIGSPEVESKSLLYLGSTYAAFNQYEQAIDSYQQALKISQASGDRQIVGDSLSGLGRMLAHLNQPELGVVFLKASMQVRETIRNDIRSLEAEIQQSYTNTIANDYRFLADLLLQDNRIIEAQRVLDLLKVQELNESLRSFGGNSDTETGVGFWQIEEELLALYEQVTTESAELADLQEQDYDSLSPEQQQRLDALQQRYETVQNQFIAFLDRPEVQALLDQIADETDRQNVDIERQHRKLQNQLRTLPQETALLYPLILPDRLELVLVTADGPPLRYPIAVTGADLNRKIVAFGQALKSPGSDIQPLAQELYSLLFAELETAIDQAGIESIIYAPDGALRYVPLAALHDGEQYLADRFSISHLVAASLTDFTLPPEQGQRRLLAAACAECSFTITVGDREFPFSDLPYTEAEVTSLAEQMPNTTVLLNQEFDLKELENRLNNYSILHLATHGAVVENAPAQSFVVLGSGETVSLETIRNTWRLDAELVVLSACETAIGSEELGSGVEILGLGYQIQEAGAQAVLASLWKVSDPGTQALMSAFYEALAQGMTKAEALQAAQRAMIANRDTVSDGDDPRAGARPLSRDGGAIVSNYPGYSHPYYWAPFILIGNGL